MADTFLAVVNSVLNVVQAVALAYIAQVYRNGRRPPSHESYHGDRE